MLAHVPMDMMTLSCLSLGLIGVPLVCPSHRRVTVWQRGHALLLGPAQVCRGLVVSVPPFGLTESLTCTRATACFP